MGGGLGGKILGGGGGGGKLFRSISLLLVLPSEIDGFVGVLIFGSDIPVELEGFALDSLEKELLTRFGEGFAVIEVGFPGVVRRGMNPG